MQKKKTFLIVIVVTSTVGGKAPVYGKGKKKKEVVKQSKPILT
jgi:hypothetical protein